MLRPMHLVIATRADPPLPLARLRARDQLIELRAPDLRFSPDEAAAFLNTQMGLNLTPEQVKTLDTRAEGWIAGLQLAALSLRERDDVSGFISGFAGSTSFSCSKVSTSIWPNRRKKATRPDQNIRVIRSIFRRATWRGWVT